MADIKAIAEELVAFTGTEVQKMQQQLWYTFSIRPHISVCVSRSRLSRLPLTKKQKQNRKARRKAQRNSRRKNR